MIEMKKEMSIKHQQLESDKIKFKINKNLMLSNFEQIKE